MSAPAIKSQGSIWYAQKLDAGYLSLVGTVLCDVVVVGGGIAGVTTAYMLQKQGKKVVLLEKNTIASGTTCGTTGKVTTQHGLMYANLVDKFGVNIAKRYSTMAVKAFDELRQIVTDEEINCDYRKADNFVYTTKESEIVKYQKEVQACLSLGLPASFETNTELPFAVSAAVRFKDQASINAVKYVDQLTKAFCEAGGMVFENSEVKHLNEGERCVAKTKAGEVLADYVVLATKIPPGPLIGRATYAAVQYPQTSYIIACETDFTLDSMYISSDSNNYSLLSTEQDGKKYLLIGGENHIPGLGSVSHRLRKLSAYGNEWFHTTDQAYAWKAMDYLAYDNLPVAGPLYPWSERTFFIGGFKKWGLNLAIVCSRIVCDYLTAGVKTDIFTPHRISAPASIPSVIVKKLLG